MRYVWLLVIACLMAAGSVRPLHVERDAQAARIDAAPAALLLVARREAPQLPELRLAPFVITPAPFVTVPPLVAVPEAWLRVPAVVVCADAPGRARGPPIA